MADDGELLRRWQAGDSAAGETLFDRHFDLLHRFFKNKAGPDAQELIQRTFLATLEKVDTLRNASSFRAFLLGIARFELLRHYRSKDKRNREVDIADASVYDLDPSPSRIAVEHEEQRLLLDALRHLPLHLQIIVELRFWEKMPVAEIAEILELPVGTTKTRVRRALELLRVELERLSREPGVLESTLTNLDRWADGVRGLLRDAEEIAGG